MHQHPADIRVLTETHCDLDLADTHPYSVRADPRPIHGNRKVRDGSTWVTIWSRFPVLRLIAVPDPRRMVAAVFETKEGPLAAAGVVLPWCSDIGDEPTPPPPARWAEHQRVLNDQMPILLASLHAESDRCKRMIAGDFNSHQALPYPFAYPYPPHEALRQQLAGMLAAHSLTCHTANVLYPPPLPPRLIEQTVIDHVCTDLGHGVACAVPVGPLADHPLVVVQFGPEA